MIFILNKKRRKLFIWAFIFFCFIIFSRNNVIAQSRFTPTPTLSPTPIPNGCGNLEVCPSVSPVVSDTPTNTPTPTSAPTSSPTSVPNTPTPTLMPTATPTVFILLITNSPTPIPTVTPSSTPTPIIEQISENKKTQTNRPEFVRSVLVLNQIPITPISIFLSAVIAAGLVLLILFPAELFNSTVQSNYDEIIKWSSVKKIRFFYKHINRVHALMLVIIFAILGAIINSLLSTDFGFNLATFSLVIGMLIALAINSLIYDVSRSFYMKKRFGHASKLRAHSLGLVTGLILVAISRFASFIPGYCYGIFTALVFNKNIEDKENGEGLAFGAIALLIVGVIGWIAWVPIRSLTTLENPNLIFLVIDAAFASFWVSMLTSTVFGLLPMRFMYGETIKNWNFKVWIGTYFTGIFLFIYTIMHPAVVIYGSSDKVSWITVIGLFLSFGIFSMLFWGYFRYRYLWVGKSK